MSFSALQSLSEVTAARRRLDAEGWSCVSPAILAWLKQRRLWRGRVMGDRLKSWDVERISSFIAEHLKPDDAVLDLGAYCSEMLPILHRRGFRRLTGIDLNPGLSTMPYAQSIDYRIGDFHHCPLADGSQQAITAVSVIEHGFQPAALLAELKRLLSPGGYFLASCDYWPQAVDTRGKTFFGMSWTLFSREQIAAFVEQAAGFGLVPVGPLDGAVKGPPPIHWDGFDYTFALLILQKRP